jgi:polysaccharide biosynthesis/export protein
MKFNRILLLLAIPFYLLSCKTTERLPLYIENAVVDTSGQKTVKVPELRFQKNDLLTIQIYSLSLKPEVSDVIYNQPAIISGGQTGSATTASTAGYLVDLNGNIVHHRLGDFQVEGMTKDELAAEIKKRLTEPVVLLTDPTVIIRLMNFRVTVLGEVNKPGQVVVPGERLTIFEAIGLSGDFTQYGKKHTVKVSREINGKRELSMIDLSSKDVFDSPYYNLAQNDIVFVEPSKQRARQADQQVVTQRISIALGVITAAAFIYNIFK